VKAAVKAAVGAAVEAAVDLTVPVAVIIVQEVLVVELVGPLNLKRMLQLKIQQRFSFLVTSLYISTLLIM